MPIGIIVIANVRVTNHFWLDLSLHIQNEVHTFF